MDYDNIVIKNYYLFNNRPFLLGNPNYFQNALSVHVSIESHKPYNIFFINMTFPAENIKPVFLLLKYL